MHPQIGIDKKPLQSASETLIALLCNPDGEIAINASQMDKKLLKEAIEKVKKLEQRLYKYEERSKK